MLGDEGGPTGHPGDYATAVNRIRRTFVSGSRWIRDAGQDTP